jgi:hypothetical protein
MTQPLFHSEQVAAEWASRICDRLEGISVSKEEVEETRNIVFAFTRIAADELSKDRTIKLPYTEDVIPVDAAMAHQIIDLFLRGINHCAKKLRDARLDWERRKTILESLAWKLFNLSKIMVGFLQHPPADLPVALNDPKDLQLMMKQSADVLLREETTGIKGGALPLPWQT